MFSSIILLAGCGEEPHLVYDLGKTTISSSTNKKTVSKEIAAYDSNKYDGFGHEAYLRIECSTTGVYLIEAKTDKIKAGDVWLNVTDVAQGYYYCPGIDDMFEFTKSPNTKGAYRSFAIRLEKGDIYYVKLTHEEDFKANYTIRITWSKDSYTNSLTETGKECKKGDLLDSMVWCNLISKNPYPKKSNSAEETVMIAYLNRDDTYAFYLILQALADIPKLNVKEGIKSTVWLVFSTAVSTLDPGVLPILGKATSAVDTFLDVMGVVEDFTYHAKVSKTEAMKKYNTAYASKRNNVKASENKSYTTGTKVVIKRTYNTYKITCSDWNDLVTKTHKSETLNGESGSFGSFFKIHTLHDLLINKKTLYVKSV